MVRYMHGSCVIFENEFMGIIKRMQCLTICCSLEWTNSPGDISNSDTNLFFFSGSFRL